jgi:hypothetical protein
MTNINTIANVAFALIEDEIRASFDALHQGLERLRQKIGAPTTQVDITN